MEEEQEKDLEQRTKEEKQPPFEPGLPPSSIHNKDAAAARNLSYDRRKRCYVDADGALMRDRYGQPL
jgi:hypothetical protein